MEYAELSIDPEFQALIPPLADEERYQLEANLLADGCRDPLVLWAETSLLLDGHNRYAICQAHGLPFATTRVSLPDREAAMDWIDANQLGRRNLAPDQASLLRGRRYNRAKKAVGEHRGNQYTKMEFPQNEGIPTAERLAAQHGVSRATIERDGAFATAIDHLTPVAPTLARDVATNHAPPKSAVIQAAALLDTDPGKAHAILYGDLSLADVKREQRRAERLVFIATQTQPPEDLTTLGRFAVLYADPPWEYEHIVSESRAIENHYPTMTLEALCRLPVQDVAYEDAVLLLWAPPPKLAEALHLMHAWGFTYRTNMMWDKERLGMGYYFRGQHEQLLLGAQGTLPTPAPADRPPSVLRLPRDPTHSAKPAAVYAMIELMYPGLPKLELFARETREGWRAWGNQV